MKKLLFCLFVLTLAISGCSDPQRPKDNSGNSKANFQYIESLTLTDIITAFSQEGLILADNKAVDRNKYLINTIYPAIFSLKDSNQILFLYIFDNIAARKQVVWGGGDSLNLPAVFVSKPEGVFARSYAIRNVLLVDMIDLSNVGSVPANEEQAFKTIGNMVSSLNDSQTNVFSAGSKNWDAQYAVEYYQHWYKDDAGITRVDQSASGKWSIKYIGSNPVSIQDVKYSYKTPTRGGRGDGILEKDGDYYYLRVGAGGDDAIPTKDGAYTITITWDGREETLNLKPINQ
jgi:hypothetical protein